MESFSHGTQGGWEKHPANPLLGGDLGTCFDISMLAEEDRLLMYFSWRDCHSIAPCTSKDGIHWSQPEICLRPRQAAEHCSYAVILPGACLFFALCCHAKRFIKGST